MAEDHPPPELVSPGRDFADREGIDLDEVRGHLLETPHVRDVHDLHIWTLTSDLPTLSAHVVLEGHPTLEEAQLIGADVKAAVSSPFAIVHATLELECEGCVDDESWCSITDLHPATASHACHRH